jgi:cell division cycle protein 20 (cofactor of APC complex)
MEENKRWPLEEVLLDMNSGIKLCRSKEKCRTALPQDQVPTKKPALDRFIPLRSKNDDAVRLDFLGEKENCSENHQGKQVQIASKQNKGKQRLLRFNGQNKASRREEDYIEDLTMKGLIRINRSAKKAPKQPRKAEKVLDAPGLVNDYYLNLIDWGKNNMLGVCLGEGAFVWNASTQEGHQFYTSDNSLMIPTSIAWSPFVASF